MQTKNTPKHDDQGKDPATCFGLFGNTFCICFHTSETQTENKPNRCRVHSKVCCLTSGVRARRFLTVRYQFSFCIVLRIGHFQSGWPGNWHRTASVKRN